MEISGSLPARTGSLPHRYNLRSTVTRSTVKLSDGPAISPSSLSQPEVLPPAARTGVNDIQRRRVQPPTPASSAKQQDRLNDALVGLVTPTPAIREKIENGADPSAALLSAARNADLGLTLLLHPSALPQGAPRLNLDVCDARGLTPLHLVAAAALEAARRGDWNQVETGLSLANALLDAGAQVLLDARSFTPWHVLLQLPTHPVKPDALEKTRDRLGRLTPQEACPLPLELMLEIASYLVPKDMATYLGATYTWLRQAEPSLHLLKAIGVGLSIFSLAEPIKLGEGRRVFPINNELLEEALKPVSEPRARTVALAAIGELMGKIDLPANKKIQIFEVFAEGMLRLPNLAFAMRSVGGSVRYAIKGFADTVQKSIDFNNPTSRLRFPVENVELAIELNEHIERLPRQEAVESWYQPAMNDLYHRLKAFQAMEEIELLTDDFEEISHAEQQAILTKIGEAIDAVPAGQLLVRVLSELRLESFDLGLTDPTGILAGSYLRGILREKAGSAEDDPGSAEDEPGSAEDEPGSAEDDLYDKVAFENLRQTIENLRDAGRLPGDLARNFIAAVGLADVVPSRVLDLANELADGMNIVGPWP